MPSSPASLVTTGMLPVPVPVFLALLSLLLALLLVLPAGRLRVATGLPALPLLLVRAGLRPSPPRLSGKHLDFATRIDETMAIG